MAHGVTDRYLHMYDGDTYDFFPVYEREDGMQELIIFVSATNSPSEFYKILLDLDRYLCFLEMAGFEFVERDPPDMRLVRNPSKPDFFEQMPIAIGPRA